MQRRQSVFIMRQKMQKQPRSPKTSKILLLEDRGLVFEVWRKDAEGRIRGPRVHQTVNQKSKRSP